MPTPTPLEPTITQAGIEAAFNASQAGIDLELTHIGLGRGLYTPVGTELALDDEVVRVTIGGGGQIAPTQVQVFASAVAPTPADIGWIGEIGIYAGSTLFAVYSRPLTPLLYLSDAVYATINYTLGLSALPPGLVNVLIDPTVAVSGLALDSHLAALDPHPQYITVPELLSLLDTDADTILAVEQIITALLNPANIAYLNVAQNWVKGQRGRVVALTDGATITPDFAESNNFSVTLEGNRVMSNPANMLPGQSGVIAVEQDVTGGRTLAYGSYFKFAAGVPPVLTSAPGAVDHLYYYVESAARVFLSVAKDVK